MLSRPLVPECHVSDTRHVSGVPTVPAPRSPVPVLWSPVTAPGFLSPAPRSLSQPLGHCPSSLSTTFPVRVTHLLVHHRCMNLWSRRSKSPVPRCPVHRTTFPVFSPLPSSLLDPPAPPLLIPAYDALFPLRRVTVTALRSNFFLSRLDDPALVFSAIPRIRLTPPLRGNGRTDKFFVWGGV
jgi:hypothetical protein